MTEITENIKWVEEKQKEECRIRAKDGVSLVGDFIENPGSKKVLLLMHGYRSCYYNDFACAVPWMYEQGFHIMLIDQRAQGRSGGKCLTFGVLEKYDCLCWVEYLLEKLGSDCEIYLHGISMGAATVLMAAGLDLPPQVKGISADSTFTTPTEIIKRTAKRYLKIDADPFMPMLEKMCQVLGHFDLKDGDTRTAIQNCKLPLLLIHGEGDKFVPCYMSEETFQAASTPHKQFIHVPDAGHGLSYLVDREACRKAIMKFWEQGAGFVSEPEEVTASQLEAQSPEA